MMKWRKETQVYMWAHYYSEDGRWMGVLVMNSTNEFPFVKEKLMNNAPECLGEFKVKKEQCKECVYVAQCILARVESGVWNSAEQERKEK